MLTINQFQKTVSSQSISTPPSTNITLPDFARSFSANDSDLYQLLKARNIDSHSRLSSDLKSVRGQIDILRQTNRLLRFLWLAMFMIMLIIGYQSYQLDYKQPSQRLGKLSSSLEPLIPINSLLYIEKQPIEPVNYSRNIFIPMPKQVNRRDDDFTKLARIFLDRYSIVGIVMDAEAQVIIEDQQSKVTHFLGVSDYLENAQLIDIQAQRVVFEINDHVVEMLP